MNSASPSTSLSASPQSDHRDQRKRQLLDSWLLTYGVFDARELDLGTLASIGGLVRDGIAPGDPF